MDKLLLNAEQINRLNEKIAAESESGVVDLTKAECPRYAVALRRTAVYIEPKARSGRELFDYNRESVLLPYEPILVLDDCGEFYRVRARNTQGYVLRDTVAVTYDRALWLNFANPSKFLVVTADMLGALSMGTRIPCDENFCVMVPSIKRGEMSVETYHIDNMYGLRVGYLPLTQKNIFKQLALCVGDVYGWGGSFDSRDCSALISEVYASFGIFLGRNAANQMFCGTRHIDLSGSSACDKERLIMSLPVGSLVYFPGHVMAYIGAFAQKPYIVHAIYGYGPQKARILPNSVIITDMDIIRTKNGEKFIDNITDAVIFTQKE
ncbi:MAG: NlpC/P60 family protein [Clostridia bacterium]|nr:NlpC/P60 family protein [Clostridia bacterium]